MSRIYVNTPLPSIPVKRHTLNHKWDAAAYSRGSGILCEGTINHMTRHMLEDVSHSKFRYVVLHMMLSRTHRRQFDDSGTEIEPNFSQTAKVRTGFLHSSYKVEAKGSTDLLSQQQVQEIVCKPDLVNLSGSEPPSCVALWVEESQLEKLELSNGDQIRLKTKGDGPFIESLVRIEGAAAKVSNCAGDEHVGKSWTDKVMDVKAQSSQKEMELPEGVDDDEWDD